MGEVLRSRVYRKAAKFTIALWLAGFVWLNVIVLAMGRFYNGLAILTDIPYCVVTIVLALGIQGWLMVSTRWPKMVRYPVTLAQRGRWRGGRLAAHVFPL